LGARGYCAQIVHQIKRKHLAKYVDKLIEKIPGKNADDVSLSDFKGIKIPGGRKIDDTIPGGVDVKNAEGKLIKRVDSPPSRPKSDMKNHTHESFSNTDPNGGIHEGIDKKARPATKRDIIDASRENAQRTGGK